jgi:L-ascorbate metabolism protein UlaG (beta-lactamase superfamily)
MKNLENIYIALLPVSGVYVMTVEEAVKAAKIIKPEIVIPMHYASIVGSQEDALQFKNLYQGRTEIMKKVIHK